MGDKQIGEKFKKLRRQHGYSQMVVASKLGVSQNSYRKTEIGLTALTVQKLIEVADVHGADIGELLHGVVYDDLDLTGQPRRFRHLRKQP